jgi:hypothetical protein
MRLQIIAKASLIEPNQYVIDAFKFFGFARRSLRRNWLRRFRRAPADNRRRDV